MGKTKIEYADEVSNPLFARLKGDESSKIGTFCEKPDAEGTCKNCWAEVLNLRFGNKLAFDKSNRDKIEWKLRTKELYRIAALNKKKPMSEKFPGLPLVVFCCDTFDIFQPSINDLTRDIIFEVYDELTNLILLIQTTYPAKMNHYFNKRYPDGLPKHYWIGMSAGTQEFWDRNIEFLKRCGAQTKYVIFEPLLEAVDMRHDIHFIDLIIVGGESGSNARPCNIDWIRSIARQCQSAKVKCFVKQLGAFPVAEDCNDFDFPEHVKYLDHGTSSRAARFVLKSRKGGAIEEFPEDLQIREFPV